MIKTKTLTVKLAGNHNYDSLVDGTGIRTVIWFQGCIHNCLGCHNPESHDINGGFEVDISEILSMIESLEGQTGITLSGGDPFVQPKAISIIAKKAHECGLDVWAYTGYTFENLLKMSKENKAINDAILNIDVLVDGKFDLDKKSLNCKFRGSTNQRIIDVKKSLECGKIITCME